MNTPGNSLETDRMLINQRCKTIRILMMIQHQQKLPLDYLKILSTWPKTVCVIKDIVDICCFCKNWYETAQEHLLFTLPPVSFKQIEKFLHFSFRTVENFPNSRPQPPGQRKLGETRPLGSEKMRISGGRPEMVRFGIDWYINLIWNSGTLEKIGNLHIP